MLLLREECRCESRCETRRLLCGKNGLLRWQVSLLFEQRQTRLLQGRREVLRREEGVLYDGGK